MLMKDRKVPHPRSGARAKMNLGNQAFLRVHKLKMNKQLTLLGYMN
ncbi:hypothetical protein KUC_1674 [Vreelandella boliviensis LC1]|uniref:Uncharacterized protein n=1 Tax=Vreelandella boliviensis LC1 TaxID=1072583 RepID=A0A7U9C3T7_9GAMM|nr:hypothetical protein KUC_1674 [Halomonas boliviensis LC1]